MAEKPRTINSQVLGLAGPSILANITVPLVGMVDLAISGHIGDAAAIGGLAVASMLFDLLYWNMGFLRVGTGGITAQAYGRKDNRGIIDTLTQGLSTALGAALFFIAIQWLFVEAAFLFISCSPEVEAVARQYFFIRIWAAPATLSLFAFKGWFIGMQNTVFSMAVDLWVNVVNMAASWLLAFHTPLGMAGIAWGTLIAQWTGLLLACALFMVRYRGLLSDFSLHRSVKWRYIKGFFKVNTDLFIRSLAFMVIYVGFTSLAAAYGDVELAVSSVMMKLFMLFSYFIDGFAYAGEALSGRFIGEKDRTSLRTTVKVLFIWGLVISAVFTLIYIIFPIPVIRLLTDDAQVLSGCGPYLFWLVLMPVASCVAFVWDGIYIGATASAQMRNCMLLSAAFFVISYLALRRPLGIQALYVAYFVHLLVRSVYLSFTYRGSVLAAVPEGNL
jgi:MATE family multidrug resistance protein